MDLRSLIDERVTLFEANKSALETAAKEKRTLKPEELEAETKRNERMAEIKATLDAAERLASDEKMLAESRGRKTETVVKTDGEASHEDAQLAFRGWAMGRKATSEMRAAAARLGVNLDANYIDMAQRVSHVDGKEVRSFVPVTVNGQLDITGIEKRALSVGTTTAGGNSVSNEMMVAYTEIQKWFAQIASLGFQVNTETGGTLPWPTVSDTANTGRQLAEATAATTTTDPTFGVVNLLAWKFSSDAVLVSYELLQDSFIDLAGLLGQQLGRRIGRKKNTLFTTGAGTTEPKGIITGATVGKTAASSTAFTLDEVIDLVHSVDLAYRNAPDSAFMAHDSIIAYLRKFKDGNGRYLWEPAVQLGQPDRFFGRAIYTNNDMASALTTGLKVLLFGSPKTGFIVRNAGGTRFIRDESIKVAEHQVYFEALERADSNVVDTTALKVLALA